MSTNYFKIMIIGLSGSLAAGKDTVAEYLEAKGFRHISLSVILRDLLKEKNIEINLENLTRVGNSILDEYGPAYLVKRAEKIADFSSDLVISSIRQPNEIEYLKKRRDFFMVFVDADIKIRFSRSEIRSRQGDSKTLEEFAAIEKKEMDGKSGGMDLQYCRKAADFVLLNNGTLDEFEGAIEKTLAEIKEKLPNDLGGQPEAEDE